MARDKVCVVIGAGDATGGAIARRFAREGYTAAKRALREDVVNVSAERRAAFVSEVVPVWVSEPVKERLRAALKR